MYAIRSYYELLENGYTVVGIDNFSKYGKVDRSYDDMGFKDWTHQLSKAPMLKAQHPGYEVYLTGVHAKRGVSCARNNFV